MPEDKSNADQWTELVQGFRLTMLKRDALIAAAKANPALLIDLIEENRGNPGYFASSKHIFNSPSPQKAEAMSNQNHLSARNRWNAVVAELKTSYPAARAVSMAVKQHPELHREMLQEVNPGKKF